MRAPFLSAGLEERRSIVSHGRHNRFPSSHGVSPVIARLSACVPLFHLSLSVSLARPLVLVWTFAPQFRVHAYNKRAARYTPLALSTHLCPSRARGVTPVYERSWCACVPRNVRLRGAVREMSDKDRSSPILVENSLKSLLDQPSIFPLIGKEEKKDADGELWGNVEAQAAFLGPNLWDKTLPYDADLKYVDLDEFLSENGIPADGVAGGGQGTTQTGPLHKINNTEAPGHQGPAGVHLEPVTKRERSPSPSECCSPDTMNPPSPADSTLSMASSGRDFDPRTRAFSDEELKPQPMIKKSRKQFVPDDLKDDKYWARRRKNNMAAKRSRDARRMKENQIALRAGFLEKENMGLRQELDRLKNENMLLRDELSKYTEV